MVNIQQIVEKELASNLFLFDMITLGIANISAIAERLQPMVEKGLKKDVKVSAISMALRRVQENLKQESNLNWNFPENLEVSLRSELFEVAIKKSDNSKEILGKFGKKINEEKGDTFTFVEGFYEQMILTNQKHKKEIMNVLKNEKITSKRDNVGYVTVNWENATKEIPGIYYRVTRALAFRGVSIQSFHTVGSEMIIVFKSDVLAKGYQTIHDLLNNVIK